MNGPGIGPGNAPGGGSGAVSGQMEVRAVADTAAEVAEEFMRLVPSAYADGVSAPRDPGTEPEQIAFTIFSQGEESIENEFDLSALWIFWGQFVDHDLDLAPEQEGAEAELIKDAGPFSVRRSEYLDGTGEDGIPREQFNAITPLMDASNVYGSDLARQEALRSFEGGRLKTGGTVDGVALLPDATDVFGPDHIETEGFIAGDIRAQENSGLTAVHTLFVNEHNYWADRFAAAHPDWTDEEVFQHARAVIETLIQKITYEEFLPVLLGDALPAYEGYDPEVDPQVTTEFATAAFRFGHTSIPDLFTFVGEDGAQAAAPLPLFQAFETDAVIEENGISTLMRGLTEERSQKIDTKVVDSLNFLLFTEDGGLTGFSLPERNILRAYDHGIPGYLDVRAGVLGEADLPAPSSTDFSIITSDTQVQAQLAAVYDDVGQVDLWVGGLAEDHVPGTTMGPLFQAILADQFARVRDADPLFYPTREWADEDLREEVMATELSDVMMRSGGIEYVQRDALLASDRIGGTEGADYAKGAAERDLLVAGDGRDFVRGHEADDDIFGGDGHDTLYGGEDDDGLEGGAGRDKLRGGEGDDILAGGDGSDMLHGGPGADLFVFRAGEMGVDVIDDFEMGLDRISLEGYGASMEMLEIVAGDFLTEVLIGGDAVVQFWSLPAPLTEADIDFVA